MWTNENPREDRHVRICSPTRRAMPPRPPRASSWIVGLRPAKRVLDPAPTGRRRPRVSRETDPLCAINLMKITEDSRGCSNGGATAPRPWASAKQESKETYVPFSTASPRDLIGNAALWSAHDQIQTELIGRRCGQNLRSISAISYHERRAQPLLVKI